jgi:hypothetical protein
MNLNNIFQYLNNISVIQNNISGFDFAFVNIINRPAIWFNIFSIPGVCKKLNFLICSFYLNEFSFVKVILITFVGNIMVILAVFKNKHLQSTTNIFLTSLAIAGII